MYIGDTTILALQILLQRDRIIRSLVMVLPMLYVTCFWSQVQEWLKNCNIYLEVTLQIALLGDLKSHSQLINNIMILFAVHLC